MPLTTKYQPVLDLMKELNVQDWKAWEEGGSLNIIGTAKNQHDKNLIWDKIKEINGENSADINADIKISDTEHFATHTVKSGESLSVISKQYYGTANRYMEIFNANKDKLSDPDKIQPGQQLVIPPK